ncbi:MAG: VOC family protein [Geodermatophilaceae bacterium]|jgi:catechol 2,3-dioxygenase-like lactoylglutathione lyase family enzyme|nr:VOC family protein [Geodermatophilaceae bacterium]
MSRRLAASALIVRAYDEAIAYYCGVLGFDLVEDTELGGGKRWVLVAPSKHCGGALLLAQASGTDQELRIGDQTGGRVFLFLHTDDFATDRARYVEAGVRFIEEPRYEPYGTVAVFEDLYGNRWDLVEPTNENRS